MSVVSYRESKDSMKKQRRARKQAVRYSTARVRKRFGTVPILELQLQRELEIAHRVCAEIGRREDQSQRRVQVQFAARIEGSDGRNGITQVDVVEDIDRFDSELKLLRLGEPELLEHRRVRAPVTGAAERVALLIAEPAFAGIREDRRVIRISSAR